MADGAEETDSGHACYGIVARGDSLRPGTVSLLRLSGSCIHLRTKDQSGATHCLHLYRTAHQTIVYAMFLRSLLLSCCLLLVGSLFAEAVQAQVWNRVRDRAEREVERRAERVTSRAVNAVLDELEDAVVCMATDQTCIDEAEEEGKPVVITDEDGELVEVRDGNEEGAAADAVDAAGVEADVPESPAMRPGEGAWTNYDFVPGDRVMFATDFEGYTIGRFPPNLEFMGGMMQLVEWEGRTFLQSSTSDSHFKIPLGEQLPERFTMEFQAYVPGSTTRSRIGIFFSDDVNAMRFGRYDAPFFTLARRNSGVGGDIESLADVTTYKDELADIRIAVDGAYATMYVNEQRVANMPAFTIDREAYVVVVAGGREGQPTLLTDIRIAAGGLELYDRLMADGRVSTQGVYFDTGSDAIRPESTGTLTEIGRMLGQHADLRLRIEGHTDNVGDADMNRALSDRRAHAVRTFLIDQHGIAPDRLEAQGMGEEQPVADNDTSEGRQNNRRVELVRLD